MSARSSRLRNFFRSKNRARQESRRRQRQMIIEGLEKRVVLDHQGLAVAFIDVDSDDQFTTNDILIAEIIDTNDSGTVNAGDTARYGALPTAQDCGLVGCDDFTPPQSTAPTAFTEGTLTFGLESDSGSSHRVNTFVSFPGVGGSFQTRFDVFYDTANPTVNIGETLAYPNSGIGDSFDGVTGDQSLHAPFGTGSAFSDLAGFHFIDSGAGPQGNGALSTNDDFLDIILGGHVPGGASLATTTVSLSGTDLLIQDTDGGDTDDGLTLSVSGSDLVINDPGNIIGTSIAGATGNGTNTVAVPLSAFTGNVVLDTLAGDDSITFDSTFDIGATSGVIVNAGDDADTVTWEATAQLASLDVTADTISVNGPISSTGGPVNLEASGDITISDVVDSGGGELTVTADSDSNGSGTLTLSDLSVGGWTLDPIVTGSAFNNSSMMLVDGRPAVAYGGSGYVGFAINSAADASGTWTETVVDSVPGTEISLAIINGKPAIAYYVNGAPFDLRFAINSAADGSGIWSTSTVETQVALGRTPSLAAVDGRPAVVYGPGVNYSINSAADGSGTWTKVGVAPGASHGSLAVVDGKPAISYYQSFDYLGYARNSAADGSGTWTHTIVDNPTARVGAYNSLAVVAGKPAISYYDFDNRDLKYAYNSAADGSGTWTATTVDGPQNVGTNTTLAIVDGRPAITYHRSDVDAVKYAINSAADGTGTWATDQVPGATVAPSVDSGLVELGDGRPAVSYGTVGALQLGLLSPPSDAGSLVAGSGDTILSAATMSLGGNGVSGTGALAIKPSTAAAIGLGGGTGNLNLDDSELANLADGFSSITIGNSTAGDIDIDTAAFQDHLSLVTGGAVDGGLGTDISNPGNTTTINGIVAPAQSGTGTFDVDGNVTLAASASFAANLNGPSDHDQVTVNGNGRTVTLNGADLQVTLGTVPAVGSQEVFVVVDSTGTGSATSGTFKVGGVTLNDGDEFTVGSTEFTINYLAGDVILTESGNSPPVINDQSFSLDENSDNTTVVGTATATDPDLPGDTLTWSITGGNTGGAFAIDSTNGEITVANKAALDFETTPAFNLTVQVEDDAGETDDATITVNLNDLEATLSIDDASVTEGNTGPVTLGFTISVSGDAVNVPFGVTYNSADGTASEAVGGVGSDDYDTASGTANFAGTSASETQPVNVAANGDTVVEVDETLSVVLSGVTGTNDVTILDGTGEGTIENDDSTTISVSDASVVEGGNLEFPVSLSNAVDVDTEITYSTADDTATTADSDYTGQTLQTITVLAGQTSGTISVATTADNKVELDETISVNLDSFDMDGRSGELSVTGVLFENDFNSPSGWVQTSPTIVDASGQTVNSLYGTAFQQNGTTEIIAIDGPNGVYSDPSGIGGSYMIGFLQGIVDGAPTDNDLLAATFDRMGRSFLNVSFNLTPSSLSFDGVNPAYATLVSAPVMEVSVWDAVGFTQGNNTTASSGTLLDQVTVTGNNPIAPQNPNLLTPHWSAHLEGLDVSGATGGDVVLEFNLKDGFYATIDNLLVASSNTPGVLGSGGTGTILNDDSATISIDDISQSETDGATTFTFDVNLSAPVDAAVSATVDTADGTALEGGAGVGSNDYEAISGGSVSFAAGTTSATIDVTVNGDDVVELDEDFLVNLSAILAGGRNVTFADSTGEGTIENDDSTTISIGDASVVEGGNLEFPVTLSNPVDVDTEITYSTGDDTATTADSDYTGQTAQTITISAGDTSGTITVATTADNKVELDETISVEVTAVDAGGREVGTGDGILYQNDFESPNGFVDTTGRDVSQQSVNALYAQPGFVFQQIFTVETLEINGTTAFGGGYQDLSGIGGDYAIGMLSSVQNDHVSLTFDAGSNAFLNFGLDISHIDLDGVGGPFGPDPGIAPVYEFRLYDSPGGSFNINSPGTPLDTAQITGTSSARNTFDWTNHAVGLSTAGSTDGNVSLVIDLLVGGYGAFDNLIVAASNTQGSLEGDNTGIGTILNDDSATISINDVSQVETNASTTFTFDVSLSAPVDVAVSATVDTADGSAVEGGAGVGDGDYEAISGGSVSFAAGVTSATIDVTVNGDDVVELDENFLVNLSSILASGRDVTFADNSGEGTIENDDSTTVSINDVSQTETDGSTTFSFTVSLSGQVDTAVSATVDTADGSAVEGGTGVGDDDYEAISGGSVGFAAGATSATIDVTVNGDNVVELDEDFLVNLSSILASGRDVTFADNSGEGTIENDDSTTVSINDVSQTETDGSTTFSFTVSLSGQVDTAVSATVDTADGSAVEGGTGVGDDDYEAISGGSVGFAAGATSATIDVTVNGDNAAELDENFLVKMSSILASGRDVTFADNSGEGTIENDDSSPVADADGPYVINEGDSLTLDASGSTDADDGFAGLTFRWDIDGDGDFDETVTGVNPLLTLAQLAALGLADGPHTNTVTVEASDGTNVVTASTSLTINNVAPTITGLASSNPDPHHKSTDGLVSISGSFSDPAGELDTHTVEVDWGDDSPVEAISVDQALDTFAGTHSYAAGGIYTITVTAIDSDGDASTSQTTMAVTQGVGLVDGVLYVIGTDGKDKIHVNKHHGQIGVRTKLHGEGRQRFAFDKDDVTSIVIYGCDGNDHIHVGHRIGIPATIFGGGGHDDIRSGPGDDTIDGGAGNDKIKSDGGNDTITDREGHNKIWSGGGDDTVTTGPGNDWIGTDGGNDTIDAGDGNNDVSAGSGNDTINTGDGHDWVWAGSGDDVVDAGDGRNKVWGGHGDDEITTGADNDWIGGGAGNDVILSGAGNDDISGGHGDDIILAGAGNDLVLAGHGDDIVNGGTGNDCIHGGRGDDLLIGGTGRDYMHGGHGDDLMIASSTANDSSIASLEAALADWSSGDLAGALVDLGAITDDGHKDYLKGDKGDDELFGGANDTLKP